jgi:peptidoglycan pentaglycine glycine transferase (the first glycine)
MKLADDPHILRKMTDPEADYFVEHHPHGHFLQSRYWGEVKSKHGWDWLRAGIQAPGQDKIIAHAMLLLRDLPGPLGRVAYLPRGPITDWADSKTVAMVSPAVKRLARDAGAFGVIIEPELEDTPEHRALLRASGWKPLDFAVQPRRTLIIDLDRSEDAILKSMKSKTRYNIGLAERKGVIVRDGSADDAKIWHTLMAETAKRDGFSIQTERFFRDFLTLTGSGDFAPGKLLIAEHERQPVAALIATTLGNQSIYLYGASSAEKRELMPTYLLQWAAMLWAKSRGAIRYDLWGVPDENEAVLEAFFEHRRDGLWGVYRFKRGFGGRLLRTVGAWVQVIQPLRWEAYLLASRARKTHGLAA